jgi:transposase
LSSPVASDARGLSAEALEVLRRRAVAAVAAGFSRAEVARLLGVSRKTVGAWVIAYREAGDDAFRPKTRGRRPGEQLALSPQQQAWAIKMIVDGTPDTHGLHHALWTRQAVAELVNRQFRIMLSATTVTQYLTRWGLLEKVSRPRETQPRRKPDPWLPDAEVLWLTWTRPHAPPEFGRGPVASRQNLLTGFRDHFGDVNVVSAVSRRGMLYFQAGLGTFDTDQTAAFLRQLCAQLGRRLNVVVCRWPAQSHHVFDAKPDTVSVRFSAPPE